MATQFRGGCNAQTISTFFFKVLTAELAGLDCGRIICLECASAFNDSSIKRIQAEPTCERFCVGCSDIGDISPS
jgi:hypothetical protein